MIGATLMTSGQPSAFAAAHHGAPVAVSPGAAHAPLPQLCHGHRTRRTAPGGILPQELWHNSVCISYTLREGRMCIPDRPGLGVTLNQEVMQKYRVHC